MESVNSLERCYRDLLARTGLSAQEVKSHLELGDLTKEWLAQSDNSSVPFPLKEVESAGLSEHLQTVREHPFLAGAHHGSLNAIAARIFAAATRLGLPLASQPFVGEFPTHEMNGCIVRCANGELILINSGLSFFLHHVAKAVGAYSVSNVPASGVAWESCGFDRMSAQVTSLSLANAIIAYMFLDLRERPRAPFVPGLFQYFMSALVFQEALAFVIAHEVAHAIKGHLDSKQASSEHEFEADELGFQLISDSFDLQQQSPELIQLVRHARSAGPLLFLSLCKLVDDLSKRPLIQVMQKAIELAAAAKPDLKQAYPTARFAGNGFSHPAPGERCTRIMTMVPPDAVAAAEAYSLSLDNLKSSVIGNVEQWIKNAIAAAHN